MVYYSYCTCTNNNHNPYGTIRFVINNLGRKIIYRQTLNPGKTAVLRMLSYLGTATPKKERAGGNPTTGRLGGQVIFQSSSRPEGPPSFKCTRLAGTLGGPTWIWRFGVSSTEAQALHVRQGAPLLIHLPQLVSASAQLWGPQSSSGSRDVTPAQVTKA